MHCTGMPNLSTKVCEIVLIFCLFLLLLTSSVADVDPLKPTLIESSIQMFANDGREIKTENLDVLTGLTSLDEEQIAYYKCKQCDGLQFTDYHYYKLHFPIAHPILRPPTCKKVGMCH
jgi:hypothetical protein